MSDFLIVKNLIKTFKGEKIPSINLSFNLKKGEKLALIGADGAGKTTLLRLISGLMLPDNICNSKNRVNPVLIDNYSPYFDFLKVKKIISYMPQRFGLYEDLTVLENLDLYFELKNTKEIKNKEKINSKIEKMLDFAGLSQFKDRPISALSGGMKQKLGLICALLGKPEILLLDEPSVGVDPISRRDLIKMVEDISNKNNISVIWATSYLDEAEHFDKILLLNEGKKLYEGTPDNAKSKMNGLVYYVCENIPKRKLLDEINSLDFNISNSTIEGEKVKVVFQNKEDIKKFPYKKEEINPKFEDYVLNLLNRKKVKFQANLKDIEKRAEDNIVLEVFNLTKKYKNFTAAKNITFNVEKGEIFGLLGPNGAGKSTTFKMLCSLIKPTYGSSKIFGFDIFKNPIEAKKLFGYMAQKFSLFGNLSVRQNIEFFMGIYGTKRSFDEVIEGYNIEKYLNYDAQNLPLGYKQRLSLLCALVNNPPVLFLDEPTSGVDPVSRREFWARINNLAKHKTTIIVTTHFMDEAQFCDKVAFIHRGEILTVDTPDNLKKSIKNEKNQNPTMEDVFVEILKGAKV